MTRKQKLHLAAAAAVALNAGALAQFAAATDIYTETWTTNTPGAAPYTTVSSSANGSASVVSGVLTLTNGSPAVSGTVQTSTPTTGAGSIYDTSFNPSFDLNANQVLTWNLNLQNSRSNPSGFGSGNYGSAYVLGGSAANFMGAGEGYAVVIGSTLSDPVTLVKYTAGMTPIGTGAKSAPYAMIVGGAEASQKYESVRVTYNTVTDVWKMYLRDDGPTAFTDAITTPVPDGNLVGSFTQAATATSLGFSGFVWNHATAAGTVARFDNIKLAMDTYVPPVPRNLTWDADGTGTVTDGSGAWGTVNTWINDADATHTTFDSSAPDNATIGANLGTGGTAAIDLGAGQVAGVVTLLGNSSTYTLNNGTLTIQGYDTDPGVGVDIDGLLVHQSSTINSSINWTGNADMHVNGSGNTLTVNGALAGGGSLDKWGNGTLLLTAASPARSGVMNLNNGVTRVTTASGGISGLGTGQTNIKSGATLHLDGSAFTEATPMLISSSGGALFVGDQSTLRVSGFVQWQKNYPMFSNGPDATNTRSSTIQVDAGGQLLWRAQIRNSGTTPENFHTINVVGPGKMKIANSGSNGAGDSALFGGSWNLTGGTTILAQNTETGGSSGDTLNALGFKNGDSSLGNRVTVAGTAVLVGTENAPNPSLSIIDAYKADVVMSGGTIASGNGKDSRWGGPFSTVASTTSTVAVYDPLNPTVARNVSLTHGTGNGFLQQGNTNWAGALVVSPGALVTGGSFNISREGGVVSVTPGASIQVLSGATMNLGINQGNVNGFDAGTLDALSDGANHVNVTNNGTFNVYTGTKNVGAIDGTGNTTVTTGTDMNATRVRQGTFTVSGPRTTLRPQASPYTNASTAGTSKVTSLVLGASSLLDVTNTKIITQDPSMVSTPVYDPFNDIYIYDGIHGLVQTGKDPLNGGSWTGTSGIITSQPDATTGSLTTLAVGTGAELRFLGPTDTELFAGQTINGNSTVVMYTWGGDANMDGKLDGEDYFRIDSNSPQSGVVFGFANGDFNYDGKINGEDYTIIDGNITFQQASGLEFYVRDPEFADSGNLAAVPEPASLGVLSLAATGLLRRRRRAN